MKLHQELFGKGDDFPVAKHVYNELWDDWALRSPQFGGNEKLYNFLKEYGLEKHNDLNEKYSNPPMKWFKL